MKFILKSLLILSSFLSFSCGNRTGSVVSLPVPYKNEFENELQNLVVFKINTKRDTLLVTDQGTRIKFTKEQFLTKDGNVMTGSISLELREYTNVSQMILGKLSTVSDDQLIATDGMFYINALSENGDTLKLNPEKPIQLEFVKNDLDSGYYVFYNDKSRKDVFNWKKAGQVHVPEIWDTTSNESFLSKAKNILNVLELGFVNCDKFIKNENSGEILASINSDIDVPVVCTIVLKKYKTMVTGGFDGTTFNFKNLPVNEDAVLVCLGKIDNKYYLVMKDFTTGNGLKLNETMQLKTKEQALTELKKLNNIHTFNN